jgi:YHS domain-containing protein
MAGCGVEYSQEHSSKQEGIAMKNTVAVKTAVKDPVCGMELETADAAGHTEHKGKTHYFCAPGCKEKFDANPEQYVGKSSTAAKSGHGCCG